MNGRHRPDTTSSKARGIVRHMAFFNSLLILSNNYVTVDSAHAE